MLNAVTKAANWQPKVSASNLSDANVVTGRGVAWRDVYNPIAMAPTAAIADVEVNKKTGKITVKHVYHAMSAGLAVYPDGIENQIVGGIIQVVSWTLVGAGAFTQDERHEQRLRHLPAPPLQRRTEGHADRDPVGHVLANPYAAGVGEAAA